MRFSRSFVTVRRQSEGLQRQIPVTILNLISNGLLNSEKGLTTAENAATTFLQNLGAPPLPLVPTNPVSTDVFSQSTSALGGFFPADPTAVGVVFVLGELCKESELYSYRLQLSPQFKCVTQRRATR